MNPDIGYEADEEDEDHSKNSPRAGHRYSASSIKLRFRRRKVKRRLRWTWKRLSKVRSQTKNFLNADYSPYGAKRCFIVRDIRSYNERQLMFSSQHVISQLSESYRSFEDCSRSGDLEPTYQSHTSHAIKSPDCSNYIHQGRKDLCKFQPQRLTIEQAIGMSHHARLLLEAKRPHRVTYANAAYGSVGNIKKGLYCARFSSVECAACALFGKQHVMVYPVMSLWERRENVEPTHFLLELPSNDSDSSILDVPEFVAG